MALNGMERTDSRCALQAKHVFCNVASILLRTRWLKEVTILGFALLWSCLSTVDKDAHHLQVQISAMVQETFPYFQMR